MSLRFGTGAEGNTENLTDEKSAMRKQRGVSAWLVTWEWIGEHAKCERKVAEILDPRFSPEKVREIVELHYHRTATLDEKIAWRLRKGNQQYPAKFQTIEGLEWRDQIICGHNPWLLARLVDELVVERDSEEREIATWQDRSSPKDARKVIIEWQSASRNKS